MKNPLGATILVTVILLIACGCRKTPHKYLLVSEVTHFQVQGNGKALNLPIFAGTLDVARIAREISLAQYYYDKLSSVYDFKSFTVIGSGASETLVEEEQRFHEPQSIYCHEDSLSRLQLSLTGFTENTARYVLRIADKSNGQVRDHEVEVPAGQSASIGSLYDPARNQGYILAVSALTLEITPDLKPKQLLDFLQSKNTPRGSRGPAEFKAGDQRWADEFFGSGKLHVPVQAADSTESGEALVPYDTPPEPLEGMMALMQMVKYPASAIKDSIEGQVLIELEISEQGKVMSARVKRGVRADLDSAAVQAMRKADFKPALYQSKSVAVKVTVPIMFKLAK